MISYDFVPIYSQKGVLFFETPGTYIFNFISYFILDSILYILRKLLGVSLC